jgi:predicted transcriptional regulator
VPVIFARELGDDFTVTTRGLFFGDVVVGRPPFVAIRKIQKLFPPAALRVREGIHAPPLQLSRRPL